MSHITRIRTIMKDARHLVAALRDLGLKPVGGDGDPQAGWVKAGGFTFQRSGTDSFALIGDSDQPAYDAATLKRIVQRYAYHVAREKLEAQGFSLVDETQQADGQLHLVMRRMA